MTDLVQRITEAIFRQEGESELYTNPGNLRAAPWLTKPVISNGFWVPKNRAEGEAGAFHCIALRVAMGQTLRELISAWAPPSENKTEIYIQNVKKWAEIPDENLPLLNWIE
jgi:hypothetical protein